MRRRHGDTEIFLVRDQVLLITSNLLEPIVIPLNSNLGEKLAEHGIPVEVAGRNGERLFRFDYMFRKAGLPPHKPDPQHLIKLGQEMTDKAATQSTSKLWAGYTFLGQFIDHDLSFNANEDLSLGGQPVQLQSKRSPSLDLDSLYGFEPDEVMKTELGKLIYNGPKLQEGPTDEEETSLPSTNFKYFHDLPRRPKSPLAALVDSRNDDNLAVAQTHVAFIKFHNAIVDQLSGSVPPGQLFWLARERVIRHYQRVILEDFLPSILHPTVMTEMQSGGPKWFVLKPKEEPFMPLEFAVAAFRMGHSLVTSLYQWNSVFQSTQSQLQPASLEDLFVFTGHEGLKNHWHITSDWIIDWTRFFDFSGFPVMINKPSSQAGKIDAVIARRLTELAPIPKHPYTRSLAVRNLLRGYDVGLPTGQDVAKLLGYDWLKPEDFADLPYYETLSNFHFDEFTPLWLYILHEARIQSCGERLGLVGSRIVAETFLTLIQTSRITILPPGTKWQLPPENERYRMTNLLAFVNDASEKKDFLNPLG
jgi:Animal haem peroxidase